MVEAEGEAMLEGAMRPADPLRGIRRLAIVTSGATLLLIAMGGAVRATDSGLACPDWPACYGRWIPPADVNMWFEHSHRLWAGVVGILIAWLTVWAVVHHREVPSLWRLGSIASVLVLVQAGLGAAVVLLQLRAGLVTAHLGMSWVIVACLIGMAVIARPAGASSRSSHLERRVGRFAVVVAVAVFLQGMLGGQATGRGAAYVFNAVPIWLAGDTWSGHMREILHVSHRFAGYLVAGLVIAFALAARRWARMTPGAARWVVTIPAVAAALVVIQVGLGITNVLTQATVWSAIGHLTVASWLWAVVVTAAVLGLVRPVPVTVADRAPVLARQRSDEEIMQ